MYDCGALVADDFRETAISQHSLLCSTCFGACEKDSVHAKRTNKRVRTLTRVSDHVAVTVVHNTTNSKSMS